jgi:hypothetical protein
MDPATPVTPLREQRALLITALAPLVPQILGSAFNIWYNAVIIEPMLPPELKRRFLMTVIVYNAMVFPAGILLWLQRIHSFAEPIKRLRNGLTIDPELLGRLRRRLIHLPWYAATISGLAWFFVFRFSWRRSCSCSPTSHRTFCGICRSRFAFRDSSRLRTRFSW